MALGVVMPTPRREPSNGAGRLIESPSLGGDPGCPSREILRRRCRRRTWRSLSAAFAPGTEATAMVGSPRYMPKRSGLPQSKDRLRERPTSTGGGLSSGAFGTSGTRSGTSTSTFPRYAISATSFWCSQRSERREEQRRRSRAVDRLRVRVRGRPDQKGERISQSGGSPPGRGAAGVAQTSALRENQKLALNDCRFHAKAGPIRLRDEDLLIGGPSPGPGPSIRRPPCGTRG